MRTAITSSLIGTSVEWCDFFLDSAAASPVFDELFFPTGNPAVSTVPAHPADHHHPARRGRRNPWLACGYLVSTGIAGLAATLALRPRDLH
ncbi:hypothetical protein [Saccharopolyspora griseoalba]|uniref:Uncharacterized protein n=1 Tax=Saccharopolyspora griseoalba TaxID=1431848 RepID=A0ABW2LK06_9PSEU